ncbi:MAG: GspE/PulE family protein [Planctomycetota bacterium]
MSQFELPADASEAVDAILNWSVLKRATDIHFVPRADASVVRARIDGQLRDICEVDAETYRRYVSRLKVMAEVDIAERRRPQDGRLNRICDDRDVDFRLSLVPSIHGESVVLRVLDRSFGLVSLDGLGLGARETGRLRSLVSSPSGMVVVTGPTGAGKTTTLYAALAEASSPSRNAITIEDPVEYELPSVLQTAIQPKIGVHFADMLRSLLRHDPDVIMIGEIRDPETAAVAVRASLTGHLVLTSLHTQRASEAISTLVNLGVKPYALAPALQGVIAQQLVRKICASCRETFEYGDEVLADPDMARAIGEGETASFSIGNGCDECFQTGYRGRLPIVEILTINEAVRDTMYRDSSARAIERSAVECGMLTLRQKGFRAVTQGLTSIEEVVRAVPIE